MRILNMLVEMSATAIDAVVMIALLHAIMGVKRKSKLMIAATILVFVVITNLTDVAWIQTIAILIIGMIYSCMCIKGKVRDKMITCLAFNISLMMINMLISFLFMQFSGIKLIQLLSFQSGLRYLLLTIDKTVIIVICIFIISKISCVRLSTLEAGQIVLLLISSTLILDADYHVIVAAKNNEMIQRWAVVIAIGMLLVNAMSILVIFQIAKMHQEKLEDERLLNQMNQDKQMLLQMERSFEELQVVRHDLKHYFTVIGGLLEQESYEQAKEIVNHVLEKQLVRKNICYMKDTAINAVLNEKQQKCKDQQIPLDICITGEIYIEDKITVAILLSNLIDNAIEAQLPLSKKRIELSMYEEKKMYVMIIKNNIKESVLKKNPGLKSTKTEYGHGFGLTSVREAVKKLDGHIQFSENGHQFVVEVLLCNQ